MRGIEKLEALPHPEVAFWDRCDQGWWSLYTVSRDLDNVAQEVFWYDLCDAATYMLNVLELG